MENPEQEEFNALTEPLQTVEPSEAPEREAPDAKPALVVNIYSWATPVAALVMLVVGLLLGYFGRPLLSADTPAKLAAQATQTTSSNSGGPATPTADIMAFLVKQTQHFKGNPNATVTFIEFSDYQ